MDFLLAMSIYSSAADIPRETARAHERVRAWGTATGEKKGAAAAEQQGKNKDEPRAQVNGRPQEEKRRLQGRPCFAPEFDGLNCFETLVSH